MHHIDVTHECDRCTTSWYRIYVSHLWTAFMYQVTVSHLCETSVDQAHVSHLCMAYTYHMDLDIELLGCFAGVMIFYKIT